MAVVFIAREDCGDLSAASSQVDSLKTDRSGIQSYGLILLPENLQPRREDFAMSETRLNEKARDAMPTPSSSEVNSTVPSWLAPFKTRQDLEPLSGSGWMGVITGFFSVLALPIVYGGLVGLLFVGLWVHATNLHGLLEPHNETSLAFYAPIVGGVLVLVFMIVPFLFTRRQS